MPSKQTMSSRYALLPHKLLLLMCLALLFGLLPGVTLAESTPAFPHPYGVFLSCDPSQAVRFADYQTIVIDAAYFTQKDIATLKAAGHSVYTYLNVGALESFRPYYSRFVDKALADYKHWDEERWMDVSDAGWQTYLTDTLAEDSLRSRARRSAAACAG